MIKKVRLQKFLADAGIASRRKAEALIAEGKVKVNGRAASVGDSVDPRRDTVLCGGARVEPASEKRYIMLNKPRGYITTMSDEQGRKCVSDLVRSVGARVYPVGRLDRESEGLLLLTNDGDFANSIIHPSHHVSKTYRVTIHGAVTEEQLSSITAGMMLDGQKTLPAEVSVFSKQEGREVLELTIYEGRNRQIRRMCEELGLEVARLRRIRIGGVKLGMLPPGKWRELEAFELKALWEASREKPERGGRR